MKLWVEVEDLWCGDASCMQCFRTRSQHHSPAMCAARRPITVALDRFAGSVLSVQMRRKKRSFLTSPHECNMLDSSTDTVLSLRLCVASMLSDHKINLTAMSPDLPFLSDTPSHRSRRFKPFRGVNRFAGGVSSVGRRWSHHHHPPSPS